MATPSAKPFDRKAIANPATRQIARAINPATRNALGCAGSGIILTIAPITFVLQAIYLWIASIFSRY